MLSFLWYREHVNNAVEGLAKWKLWFCPTPEKTIQKHSLNYSLKVDLRILHIRQTTAHFCWCSLGQSLFKSIVPQFYGSVSLNCCRSPIICLFTGVRSYFLHTYTFSVTPHPPPWLLLVNAAHQTSIVLLFFFRCWAGKIFMSVLTSGWPQCSVTRGFCESSQGGGKTLTNIL